MRRLGVCLCLVLLGGCVDLPAIPQPARVLDVGQESLQTALRQVLAAEAGVVVPWTGGTVTAEAQAMRWGEPCREAILVLHHPQGADEAFALCIVSRDGALTVMP